MKFVLHQFNPRLGNIEYNVTQIAAAATEQKGAKAKKGKKVVSTKAVDNAGSRMLLEML